MNGASISSLSPQRWPAILQFRVEFEGDPRDLDVVARLESFVRERAQHSYPLQPPLQMSEGVLVVQVVASDQPLDPGAADAKAPVGHALDGERARRGRPVDAMLGELARCWQFVRPGLPVSRFDRDAAEHLARQLLEA